MVTSLVEGCWDGQLEDALYAKCQDESLKPQFVTALLGGLLQRGHAAARSFALTLIHTPLPAEGRKRDLAIGSAAALLQFAPDPGWPLIWAAFQADKEFGKAVTFGVGLRIDWQGAAVLARLNDNDLANLYLWVLDTYAEVKPKEEATWMGPDESAFGWRNGILELLQSRGTESACEAIIKLMRARPDQAFLKWSLQRAQEMARFQSWEPVEPEIILQLARDSTKRLVRSAEELLGVIIESLGNLANKLRGETPLVSNLWNEVSPGMWKPKEEDHFTDNVKQHLEDDLRSRGVVLNREVQIRRNRGKTKGERTDIHVDAVVPGTSADQMDIVTVIIEVKGCWNSQLWISMSDQLANRYLAETRVRHGLYLVGWFNCPQWCSKDSGRAPKCTLREAQARLDKQANELSQGRLVLKAVVLDASLR
jgi:hypothetical protein